LRVDQGYDVNKQFYRERQMTTKLEQEEYLYRRAINIIDSPDTDDVKENLLFQEVWIPLAELYKDKIIPPKS
jgi:hypothetical protein